jgi:hypothetical protein
MLGAGMGKLSFILALAMVTTLLLGSVAYADDASALGSWTVARYQSQSCAAQGPVSGNVALIILVMEPEFKLLISSPDFHIAEGTYPVSISLDGGPHVAVNALGEEGVYAIALVRNLGMALRSASTLTAIVGDNKYEFAIQHADAAMDAASRCAGEPSWGEFFSHPPREREGAGDWKLVDNLQGSDRCTLRLNGSDVDTMIMRNNDGQWILMAGRADWALPAGQVKISLQLDDAPAQDFDAPIFDNLVFVVLKDPALADHLPHTQQLRWHLPWGDFRANLGGLNVAIDQLSACDLKKAQQKHG